MSAILPRLLGLSVAVTLLASPALAQSAGADTRDGLTIDGGDVAPGGDFCRNADDPIACSVARGAVNDALSSGADIAITVKKRRDDQPRN
jgi:hypothetical protein